VEVPATKPLIAGEIVNRRDCKARLAVSGYVAGFAGLVIASVKNGFIENALDEECQDRGEIRLLEPQDFVTINFAAGHRHSFHFHFSAVGGNTPFRCRYIAVSA
jgi:hypothetical protein